MDYLLKSSAIIALFYMCYVLFMQKETFFVGNRWFLFGGIIASLMVPFIIIPVYVAHDPSASSNFSIIKEAVVAQPDIEHSFDSFNLISLLYFSGVIFFLGKLFIEFASLLSLLRKHPVKKDGWYALVETEGVHSPFSFFRWIVYHPNQFKANELDLILKHEKIHAKQWHSIDILFMQLVCALFWFNPFVWLYKKALQQNLEFIADHEVQSNTCQKNYQNLLLKATVPSHRLALTNNFYNSLIKKRIVMLHKSKSNKKNTWKYSLMIPVLIAFVWNFNTEVIAQTKNPESEKVKIGQNVLKFVITKDTKDSQLESIKQKLADKKASITFGDITRNDRKEITGIKIDYGHQGKKGNFFINSENPIKDIVISLNVNENELSVGQATKNLSQSFEIITEDGEQKVKASGTGSNVFVYSTDDTEQTKEKIVVVGKDGEEHEVEKEKKVYIIKSDSERTNDDTENRVFVKKSKKDTVWIKKDVKNIVWTDDDGNDVEIIAVERGKNNIRIFTDGDEQPLIFLDGKEISKKEMENVKPEDIQNVNVLKGEQAIKKHGEKAKHGVIEITTHKN